MGRKPKAAKLEAMSSDMAKISSVPSKLKRSEPETQKSSSSISTRKKASKVKTMILRRSGRRQNSVPPARGQEIGTVIEQINLVESDREDETYLDESEREDEPLVEGTTTEPIMVGKSLEEKVDQLVEDVEELKSKESKRNFSEAGPSSDRKYKSLYIHSQKKIEALTNENGQLNNQLQIAQAKIEAYENVKDVMDKLRDVIMASNLTKATEAMANLSSKAMFTGASIPSASIEPDPTDVPESPAKKKRGNKGNK